VLKHSKRRNEEQERRINIVAVVDVVAVGLPSTLPVVTIPINQSGGGEGQQDYSDSKQRFYCVVNAFRKDFVEPFGRAATRLSDNRRPLWDVGVRIAATRRIADSKTLPGHNFSCAPSVRAISVS
jgi:hypothetical protein